MLYNIIIEDVLLEVNRVENTKRYFYRKTYTGNTEIILYKDGEVQETKIVANYALSTYISELGDEGYTFGYPPEELDKLKKAMEDAAEAYECAKKNPIISEVGSEGDVAELVVEDMVQIYAEDLLDYFGINKEGVSYKGVRDCRLYTIQNITPLLARKIRNKVNRWVSKHDRHCEMKYVQK